MNNEHRYAYLLVVNVLTIAKYHICTLHVNMKIYTCKDENMRMKRTTSIASNVISGHKIGVIATKRQGHNFSIFSQVISHKVTSLSDYETVSSILHVIQLQRQIIS